MATDDVMYLARVYADCDDLVAVVVPMPTVARMARHLLAMQAVVDQTREYEIEHANPVPDYTLRRMIRERLFKALAALDKLKEGR